MRLTATEKTALEATISGQFKAHTDGTLLRLISSAGLSLWEMRIERGSLLLTGATAKMPLHLDLEDTVGVADGTIHQLSIRGSASGSEIFLDGYQCFSTTAHLAPAGCPDATELAAGHTLGIEVWDLELVAEAKSSQEIAALAPTPVPLVEFAANHLAAYDVAQVTKLAAGTIFARFRTRGPGQNGTILAASRQREEVLRLSIDESGLTYRVRDEEGQWRSFFTPGTWDQGHWHDVLVRAGRGATQIWVDGFLEAHLPGVAFFADSGLVDQIVIGQDTTGLRLFGEVRNAAIYPNLLTEGQIKHLSLVAPLETKCLFDQGYHESVSYRIPSLFTTASGTVLAGADQRETIPNDAPNSVNFVLRRSLDSGQTWEELQTVLSYPGEGAEGASVIDSCIVQDRRNGRIFVLIDHFPGRIGQPNNQLGVGVDPDGQYLLFDDGGRQYTWTATGAVLDGEGNVTPYWVSQQGDVTVWPDVATAQRAQQFGAEGDVPADLAKLSRPGGNVFLGEGIDPNQTLLTHRTSFLQVIHSDDEGESWSHPRNLNQQVKEPWMPFLGTGPGRGIQLEHGPQAGRLMIPAYFNNENRKAFSCTVVYSDDGGETWRRGGSPNDGRIVGDEVINSRSFASEEAATHEATLLERADGSILMLMRNQSPAGKVAASVSRDGGETWGQVYFPVELDEIFSQPNVIAASTAEHPDQAVFANASQLLPYRGRGVLRLSRDGGDTWVASRTFNPAHYVYQCLTVLPDGDLGLLWERETQGLYFTRIPLSWLEAAL